MDDYWRQEPVFDKTDWKRNHYCELTQKYHLRGGAIEDCVEDETGRLFVANGEYGSQVNFCPVCGYEAKVKIE